MPKFTHSIGMNKTVILTSHILSYKMAENTIAMSENYLKKTKNSICYENILMDWIVNIYLKLISEIYSIVIYNIMENYICRKWK